jgi:hypothetical protein
VREGALARLRELEVRAAELIGLDGQGPLLPKGIGRAIMTRLRIGEGPRVGEVKAQLEQAVLDGLLPRNAPVDAYLEHLDRIAGRGTVSVGR